MSQLKESDQFFQNMRSCRTRCHMHFLCICFWLKLIFYFH